MNVNNELERENDGVESSEVTDGENFSANEEQDQEATNETVPNNFTISEYGKQPNDEQQHEGYDDFGSYEEFFKEFAIEHSRPYIREENSDFKISIGAGENKENTTYIQIDHGRNLTMTAKDNNGKTVVPDQEMFDAIAKLANDQHTSITFGNIETPEYAARLYIACRTHQPYPIEMIGVPEMNDEFLGKLDQDTKARLDEIAAKETESKQDQTYDEAPTESQEELNPEEDNADSNTVDFDYENATEHTEQDTTSTSESEGVQAEKEVEFVHEEKEEDSNSTNNFAADLPKITNAQINHLKRLTGRPLPLSEIRKKSPVTNQQKSLLQKISSQKSY